MGDGCGLSVFQTMLPRYNIAMERHQDIDERALFLAKAIVEKVELGSIDSRMHQARRLCLKWLATQPCSDLNRWNEILAEGWELSRKVLLDPSEEGVRLRQSNPFCGVLSPKMRWTLLKDFAKLESKSA
jgi:hypothetical protein